MERRGESGYVTEFENMLPDLCKIIDEQEGKVANVRIIRFGGDLFGSFNVTGQKNGDTYHLQVDDVLPTNLSAYFMGVAMVKGEVCPGGIYIIDYKPEPPEKKLAGLNRVVGPRNGHFGY